MADLENVGVPGFLSIPDGKDVAICKPSDKFQKGFVTMGDGNFCLNGKIWMSGIKVLPRQKVLQAVIRGIDLLRTHSGATAMK